jgi:hypothetical protein
MQNNPHVRVNNVISVDMLSELTEDAAMKVFGGFVLGIATAVCFLAYSGGHSCFVLTYLGAFLWG